MKHSVDNWYKEKKDKNHEAISKCIEEGIFWKNPLLTARERLVLQKVYIEKKSIKQTSKEINRTPPIVKNEILNARRKISIDIENTTLNFQTLIENTSLSNRVKNSLVNANYKHGLPTQFEIKTINDIIKFTAKEILSLRNMGVIGIEEIKLYLKNKLYFVWN